MSERAQRIVVMGCSGSGKSTLARAIGAKTGLPVVHLDTLYWQAGWKPHPDMEAFAAGVRAVTAGERWVIDGGFTTGSAAERFARADVAVLFDLPRRVCLWRAIKRYFTYRGETRPDLAPGCPEKFDLEFYRYIWSYPRSTLPKVERFIADHFRGRLVRIRHDRDVAAFFEGL